jgi:electron transfer flavoprotein beta subunit
MNILVCIKPVPDPEKYGDLRIDPETKRLVREGVPTVINPEDKNALEEALQLKAEHGGSVFVLSMAPEFSRDKLVESLAMGADEAYLLSDRAFGGADTYVTSYVLAEGARRILAEKDLPCFDLILMGNASADGATSHVPTQIAEWLNLPHVCNVREIRAEAAAVQDAVDDAQTGDAQSDDAQDCGCGTVQVVRKTESEDLLFEVTLPAVVAVTREINKPRLINAMGIIKARKKPLTIWSNEDLALPSEAIGLTGSPTQPGALFSPDLRRGAAPLGSELETAADKILELMQKAGV